MTSLQVVWSHDKVEGSLGQAISNLVRTQGPVKRSTAAVGFFDPETRPEDRDIFCLKPAKGRNFLHGST